MDNTTIEIGNSYKKIKMSPHKRHTYTHGSLTEMFQQSQCLSQSEESKCMWKHGGAVFTVCSNTCFHRERHY